MAKPALWHKTASIFSCNFHPLIRCGHTNGLLRWFLACDDFSTMPGIVWESGLPAQYHARDLVINAGVQMIEFRCPGNVSWSCLIDIIILATEHCTAWPNYPLF